jgi:hypothetical protein
MFGGGTCGGGATTVAGWQLQCVGGGGGGGLCWQLPHWADAAGVRPKPATLKASAANMYRTGTVIGRFS